MYPTIVPIVEGQSEEESVPVLLRRILAELQVSCVGVARPFRIRRNRVGHEGEMERAVKQAVRDREGSACVLVILDADDDSPADLGPELLARCRRQTPLPAAVVLANREFEAWFLGAKESLRGVCGIRADALAPADPESIRGAKERLTRNMVNRRYLEVDDQPTLADRMSLDAARKHCPSFEVMFQAVKSLAAQVSTL